MTYLSGEPNQLTSKFQCTVEHIGYNVEQRRGVVRMTRRHCCDMTGCIDFFLNMDPSVKVIQTYSGSRLDTRYECVNGEWEAYRAPHPASKDIAA